MFPIKDNIQTYSRPYVTLGLGGLTCFVFWQVNLELPPQALAAVFYTFGFTPAAFVADLASHPWSPVTYLPLSTHLLLHGNLLHLGSNLWYLWLFGRTSEACLGHGRFFAFYLLCGAAAALTQLAADPANPLPLIGSSGAVSGILGAYLVCFPRARITTFFLPFFFVDVPASLFAALWFALQLAEGLLSLTGSSATIAWWAHVGGFLTGMFLNRLYRQQRIRHPR